MSNENCLSLTVLQTAIAGIASNAALMRSRSPVPSRRTAIPVPTLDDDSSSQWVAPMSTSIRFTRGSRGGQGHNFGHIVDGLETPPALEQPLALERSERHAASLT